MKECCLQLMCFSKNEKELKQLYDFLKNYSGEVLISNLIKFQPKKNE